MSDKQTAGRVPQSVVVDNRSAEPISPLGRDATKKDAQRLGVVYRSLTLALKAAKKADRGVSDGWDIDGVESIPGLRDQRNATQIKLDGVMDEAWKILTKMPRGVNHKGATPQTVSLQFFNRNLNRDLRQRLTASEAKAQNKLAFGI